MGQFLLSGDFIGGDLSGSLMLITNRDWVDGGRYGGIGEIGKVEGHTTLNSINLISIVTLY